MKFYPGIHMGWDIYSKIAPLVKGNKILDAGCGDGTLSKHLPNKELYGIDFNLEAVIQANKKNYKVVTLTEIHKTHFKDNEFDTVVCVEVLQYLNPDLQKKAIKELKRITNNCLIVAVPNYNCIGLRSILDYKLRDSFFKSINTNYYPTNRNTLKKLGFKDIRYISCRFGFIRNLFGDLLSSEVVGVFYK